MGLALAPNLVSKVRNLDGHNINNVDIEVISLFIDIRYIRGCVLCAARLLAVFKISPACQRAYRAPTENRKSFWFILVSHQLQLSESGVILIWNGYPRVLAPGNLPHS